VVQVVDVTGHSTNYLYDPFDKLIRTTDAVGNKVTAT
jgi:YD repeat-containing protein